MSMKKILLFVLLLGASLAAQGLELEGVTVEDNAHVGNTNLVLNGAGVRSKFIFDIYIAALYLGAKKTSASAVLDNAGEKRVTLYLLREISAKSLLHSFREAFDKNHTRDELKALEIPLQEFEQVFYKVGDVKKGDYILLDYQHNVGTEISVNGVKRGIIAGEELYPALLKVWLGEKPAQEDLKRKLLGGR